MAIKLRLIVAALALQAGCTTPTDTVGSPAEPDVAEGVVLKGTAESKQQTTLSVNPAPPVIMASTEEIDESRAVLKQALAAQTSIQIVEVESSHSTRIDVPPYVVTDVKLRVHDVLSGKALHEFRQDGGVAGGMSVSTYEQPELTVGKVYAVITNKSYRGDYIAHAFEISDGKHFIVEKSTYTTRDLVTLAEQVKIDRGQR